MIIAKQYLRKQFKNELLFLKSFKREYDMKLHSNKCRINMDFSSRESGSSAKGLVIIPAGPSPLPNKTSKKKKTDSNRWKEVQVMIERMDDKTIEAMTLEHPGEEDEKSSCTSEVYEPMHDDPNNYDWKEFSIVIKRIEFIERAVEKGQKSICLEMCNELLVDNDDQRREEERSHETNPGEGWLTSFLQFFSPLPNAK